MLCKMCSRQRILPKSMHVDGGLTGELVEMERGGHATIFLAQHNNISVAIKTIRVNMNSDFDKCHSVNTPNFIYLKSFLTMRFAGILSRGRRVETSPAPERPAVARCRVGTTPAFDDIRVDG